MLDLRSRSHRRYNPLTGEWVLVSPQRTERPWQGEAAPPAAPPPRYDPHCYLCPGNARARGARNPAYTGTFVFDNDFPALDATPVPPPPPPDPLLQSEPESGVCRVLCYSPCHDLTLARLSVEAVAGVVGMWTAQYAEVAARPDIAAVMIFENRGLMMGASNPHPHGQLWANQHVPNVIARELGNLRAHAGCLLCDYLARELALGERLVCENDGFAAVVPFWAYWPYEVLLLSKAHVDDLGGLDLQGRTQLADLLLRLNIRYDNLFQTPFPASWGFHQGFHLHAHFFPPLLRSASVRKFFVGYELLAMPQRDLTPEQAAGRLRGLSERHYLDTAP